MTVLLFIARYFWIAVMALISIAFYGVWTYDSTRILWDKKLKEKGVVADEDGKVITSDSASDEFVSWCMTHLLVLAVISFIYWVVGVFR